MWRCTGYIEHIEGKSSLLHLPSVHITIFSSLCHQLLSFKMVRTKNPSVVAGEQIPKEIQQEDPLDFLFADDKDVGSPELSTRISSDIARDLDIFVTSKIGTKRKLLLFPTGVEVEKTPQRALIDEDSDDTVSPEKASPDHPLIVYQRLKKKGVI